MTTATNSSFSSGAESQIGGRMKQSSSSFNPVYNSISVSIDPPPSSLYEELPQAHVNHIQEHTPTNHKPPLPPFSSSFSTGRVTTNNTLYASSGGNTHTSVVKSSTQVYQYDHPPDIAYVDKQSGCSFTCEAAILVMGLLVVLLAGAALTMSLLLWFQVISVQTAVSSTTAPTTPPLSGECPCQAALAQRESYMTLLNNLHNVQIELDALTNKTAQNTAELQTHFDQLSGQLENSTKFIESNVSRPVPSYSPSTATFESLQECVDNTQAVCPLQVDSPSLCTGGFAEFVNSDLEVITEFSCYLKPAEDRGPVNGSASVQSVPTPSLGSYTPQQLRNEFLSISCFCFIYEAYPVSVQCVLKSTRCPPRVANLPVSFSI